MDILKKIPDRGDPSNVLQRFAGFNLQLHCCRYWWLQNWEFNELSFPYWRIYHNSYEGAVVVYKKKEYMLTPDKIMIIAPNTSYATRLYNHKIPETGYSLKGGEVHFGPEKQAINDHSVLHLFIHFNIGVLYDNILSGVSLFDITDSLKEKLQIIRQYLNYEHARFSFYSSLVIQSLISDMLLKLPRGRWKSITKDNRILEILKYVEANVSEKLSNSKLAEKTKLATNAFTRLFKEEIGLSPQRFVKKKRIDKACILLQHSNMSINEIAEKTGFADRYHFSRIFKQITKESPATYRKIFFTG